MKHLWKIPLTTLLVASMGYAGGDIEKVEFDVQPLIEVSDETVAETLPFYMGVGLSVGSVESFYYGADTVASVHARVGYDVYRYLGVEARVTLSLADGDDLGLDYSYGFYLKPQYPINKKWKLYGLVGYAQTQISFDDESSYNGITNNTSTQNGFSYGVGVSYQYSHKVELYVDATSLIDESETLASGSYAMKANTLNFGINYHF